MSSISNVKALVVQIDEQQLYNCGGVTRLIPCGSNMEVLDLYWAVPIINSGLLEYYRYDLTPSKPSIDSMRTLRVKDNLSGQVYYIGLQDDQTESTYVDACNGCCGTTPDISTGVVVPPIDYEEAPCPTIPSGTPVYDFYIPIPANPNSFSYSLSGTFNSVAGTPTPNASYANAAAILTWLQANWGAYGTWTLENSNQVLHLSSTTTKTAYINVELIAQAYCFTYPNSATVVNGIKIGGVNVLFPEITFSVANKQALVDALTPYLIGTYDTTTHTELLQYTGLQVPDNLTIDGADVAGTTFTAGICAETFNFTIPSLGVGEHYTISGDLFNGVAGVPTVSAQTFVDAAAILTWVQANWAAYGTWSLQTGDTILRLVSTTLDTAVLTINHTT